MNLNKYYYLVLKHGVVITGWYYCYYGYRVTSLRNDCRPVPWGNPFPPLRCTHLKCLQPFGCFYQYNVTLSLTLSVTTNAFKIIFLQLHPRAKKNIYLQLLGDSTLRTLHSDTKINILNPNLNVKMFNKGVQTNIENTFSVPFPSNKKML